MIPYWALSTSDLLAFLTGGLDDGPRETAFTDKIFELKTLSQSAVGFAGVEEGSITVDTPLPFSLKKLWYDLIDIVVTTLEGPNRDQPAREVLGNADALLAPRYKSHAMGAKEPLINPRAVGILRRLNLLRSRLLDRRYDFLLHSSPWKPDFYGRSELDLDNLFAG